MADHTTIHLPSLRVLLRRGGQRLLESTLVPLGLFYLVLTVIGFKGGLIAALSWSLAALVRRIVLRRPVPAVLVLTTLLLIARTAVGYFTGSIFLYFLQPTVQNFLIGFVFLATASAGRPLLGKLASDFCAFPETISGHPHVQRFFRRVSLLWALVFVTNGIGTLFVLARETVGDFLMVSTAGSYTLVGLAAAASLWWFRRCLHGEGIVLRLGGTRLAA